MIDNQRIYQMHSLSRSDGSLSARPRANAPNVLAGDRFTVGLSSVADSECDLQQLVLLLALNPNSRIKD